MPLAPLNTNFATDGTISTSKLLYTPTTSTPHAWRPTARKLYSDAYGVGTPNEDVDGNGQHSPVNLRFPGQVYDATSQLSYNYFRDYNPETGRYVQSDLIGLGGGLNTYGYALGSPMRLVDPDGLNPGAAAGAAVGSFGGPVGAAVGGVVGFGIGIWGANAAWNAYHESTNDESTSGASRSVKDEAQAQADHDAYKYVCNTPPPPTGDYCTDLKNEIKWLKQCRSMRQAWDNRWQPGGHTGAIEDLNKAIKNRERVYQNSWSCKYKPLDCD